MIARKGVRKMDFKKLHLLRDLKQPSEYQWSWMVRLEKEYWDLHPYIPNTIETTIYSPSGNNSNI